jgi:Ead/Ea22-like protein
MNPDQIEQLRALAEAATQLSPWRLIEDDHGRCVVVDADDMWVADVGNAPKDAAFIAAASPANILVLLTLLDQKCREVELHLKEIQRTDLKLAELRARQAAWSNSHIARSQEP